MNHKFMRVYREFNFDDVREHLIICGELSASCSKCKEMGLKFDIPKCPTCGTEFKYLTFRNIKENFPKIKKLAEAKEDLNIIDYDDYKRIEGARKAQELFE